MLDKMVEINIKAAIRLVRLTIPKMIERGNGSIINISSVAGVNPQPQGLLYSFTKAGLIMMTRSWAREFGPQRRAMQRHRSRPDSNRFQLRISGKTKNTAASWNALNRFRESVSPTKSVLPHCIWHPTNPRT